MTRRRTRPRGRIAGSTGASAERLLTELLAARGSAAAQRPLTAWIDRLVEEPGAFESSAKVLTSDEARALAREERAYLFGVMAQLVDDPAYTETQLVLEERMDAVARDWGIDVDHDGDAQLLSESPVYAALADVGEALRDAIEISFLASVGAADLARMILDDRMLWERLFTDGHHRMLGSSPPIEFGDDDPFGIMLQA